MKISMRRLMIATAVFVSAAGAGVNYAHQTPTSGPSPTGLHLILNVAGNRLHVYEDGERTRTYKVSVGMRGYETPAGDYTIRDVIWNPWWHPPNSAWARGRKPEPPGPANPMGRVKLNFAPLLYIHGTVDWQALGEPSSHGCVRMSNRDLIELTRLVHKYATPRIDGDVLDQLAASPSMTRRIVLQEPVRFTAEYNVATVDNGFLIIYPDHYGMVKKQVRAQVDRALKENGVDPRRVRSERLDELVEKSSTRKVAIALDSLVVRGGRGINR